MIQRYDAKKTKELLDLFDLIGERQRRPVPWAYIKDMHERMNEIPGEIVRFDNCKSCKGYDDQRGGPTAECSDCLKAGSYLMIDVPVKTLGVIPSAIPSQDKGWDGDCG